MLRRTPKFLVSAAGKMEVPINFVGKDGRRSYFMGESQELSFGPVRFEMPCLRFVEPLDSVWMSASLESRGRGPQHMDGTENCKNGKDLEEKESSQRKSENPKLSSRTLCH